MAKILYGVAGEGRGHAIRSWVVIKELIKKHEVKIVCGGKAHEFFSKKIKGVERIYAPRIMYAQNRVSNAKTFLYNLKNLQKEKNDSMARVEKIIKEFKPNLVISDFEYFSSVFAYKHNIPLVVIDNIHIISMTKLRFPKKYSKDYLIAKLIIKMIIKKADFFLLTTFFYPEKKQKNVHLFPPLIRPGILKLQPSAKDHILVYQTSKSDNALIPILKRTNEKFIVYCIKDEGKEGNIVYKKFNEKEFFNDLKDCKAIITNGGFSLIGEALFLKKPILSVPVKGQFEQIANALYIGRLGYGLFSERISKSAINKFLANLNIYRKKLDKYEQKNNLELFNKLDEIILGLSK